MKRKGQMIFEFVIAAVLFFGIVIYILAYLNASMATFSNDFYMNTLHSRALATSELLIHSKGSWSGSVPASIGLMGTYPVLDGTKMSNLAQYCGSNYQDVLKSLNLLESPFSLQGSGRHFNVMMEINKTDGTSVMQCGLPAGGAQFAEVRRVSLSDESPNKNILLVSVQVW